MGVLVVAKGPSIRLQYFPANAAWAFTFGDSVLRMGDAEMFFRKRGDAVAEAKRLGLTVERNGSVHVTRAPNPRRNPDLFDSIRFGDRVTIVNRFGQERTGKATIHNREADLWVLNMGGPHGTPGIATRENVTRVKAGRRNPYGPRAKYRHKRLRSPRRFARKSLRLTPERKGVRVVVGRLKGERRRVKRGARKGRPVLTAQAVLTRKRNRAASPPYSERQAWKAVQEMARRIARGLKGRAGLEELEADAIIMGNLAEYMLDQVARGVHKNPLLAVFGNPPKGAVTGSDDIQAILYRHKEDGRDYVHPFGQGVKVQLKRDGSTVIRAAVNARSGVRAIGLPNGSVLLRHPTKPIWRDF